MTTIISALRTYLLTYSALKTGAPLWVDYLGPTPTQYAIVPLAGPIILEAYIDGGSSRAFPFAFQSMESTADDLVRLENNGFYEAFQAWLASQTLAGSLPTLDTGMTPTAIEATGWSYLFEEGESDTGIYQIQCRLLYDQQP